MMIELKKIYKGLKYSTTYAWCFSLHMLHDIILKTPHPLGYCFLKFN
jgi:hypothetical protein